jgi:error-prone DNA polymerase
VSGIRLPFAHLHVASSFSMQYGVSTPEALVARAVRNGQSALAVTDRDGVRGAVRFVRAAAAAGLPSVLGAEVRIVSPQSDDMGRATRSMRRTPVRGGTWRGAPDHRRDQRVVLLARDQRGWASLCRLLSTSYERDSGALTLDDLAERHDGLVALIGPSSTAVAALDTRRPDLADRAIAPWREIFGEHLCIQITSHRHERGPLSTVTAARTLGWAHDRGLPTLLAHAVRFVDPAQARISDILDAARRLVPLDERHRDRVNAQGFLADTGFLADLAGEIARAAGADDRTGRRLLTDAAELAEQCALTPADLGIGEVFVPEDSLVLPRGERDADAILRARCTAALTRYSGSRLREARDRLEAELRTIATMGFATYFLTVAEVVDLTRARGIRVAARGSGAGSLVVHLLDISGVDPIEHGLLMERFCTPLRRELPDIDIDVESARRLEVYDAIFDRFGTERVATVSMPETYRVRHAIRDVGAALGWPPGEIDMIAKAFPRVRARQVRAVLAELPELRHSGIGRLAARGELDMVLDLVEGLDGLPRHLAMHPCGVIISDASLLDRTPVEPSGAGYPMSSFDKDDVERLGLLKLDVLGVRMQSALAYAVDEVARIDGEHIDLDAIARDDDRAFALVQSTRTLGCFQIESPGQRELIGKFAPETFGDLIVDISLFRPGPVSSDMITPFLAARHGWRDPSYLHDDLRPILADTYGVVVFHEQVLRIIATMTGCSLAEADETRRSMKNPDVRVEIKQWFIPAAQHRGYDSATVDSVWDVLEAFASFGFCKAHAAAFALPTYQSAWFKAHHPAAFLAGVLTHDPGMYPKRLILNDARSLGITILGLDINISDAHYRVERVPMGDAPPPVTRAAPSRSAPPAQLPDARGYAIRLSLLEVSGMGEADVARIIEHRPYRDLIDFHRRCGLATALTERLIQAGAFDTLHAIGCSGGDRITRRDLLLQIGDLARGSRSVRRAESTTSAQLSFDDVMTHKGNPDELIMRTGLPEMTDADRVQAEMDILGLDVTCHLMDFYAELLTALNVTRSRDLLACRSRASVLVAGAMVLSQTPPVRSGRRVIFTTLEDTTGPVDVAFFDDVQHRYVTTVFTANALLVRGIIRRTGPRGISIRATACWDLADVHRRWREEGRLAAVHEVLSVADQVAHNEQVEIQPVRHPYLLRGGSA